ncbi:M48 family metallopeptidase [Aspergillus ibericus CBS 121593]|uniref:Peptidase M48 domain-containing protein n=1 Tax=Aspergillus ibericus CBS 121593 TaxID=1448316 RepID=A0A395H953_9EURO|nr:hypothetical protein BO80DRAFT_348114 [Aspergillus ibericus CBS 121593]RAL04099.1 hypothetical protein BO80DRAFT_348114 [Aspergillus ibericus CBS 121593]
MFRPPIVRAFSRVSLRPVTASSSRIPSQIPRSATSGRFRGPSSAALLPSTQAFGCFLYRPFSRSARSDGWDDPNSKHSLDWAKEEFSMIWKFMSSIMSSCLLLLGLYYYNMETVELTGRRRFNCVPPWLERQIGDSEYRNILSQVEGRILPADDFFSEEVNRVCARLVAHAPIHYADWKVHVINDFSEENAFVLPGGRVFVFTGILPLCKDTDGLAAVLGHEIAHVLAGHAAEEMSRDIFRTLIRYALITIFGHLGQLASGLIKSDVNLPKSREQEAEADTIGLMLMAKACYNPGAAVKFWERNHKLDGEAVPQIMSTHPTVSQTLLRTNTPLLRSRLTHGSISPVCKTWAISTITHPPSIEPY